MSRARGLLFLAAVLALSGCAVIPTGPSVMVWPAPWKPFEIFQADDATCRQWAAQQTGAPPADVVNQNTASGAVVGTLIGAGLGAAIGAAAGNPGVGAAIGAGSGLLTGTVAGANAGYAVGGQVQWRYDTAYQQCMYAKGNQIPGYVSTPGPGYSMPPPPPPPPRARSRAPGPPPAPGSPPPPPPQGQ